MKDIYGNDQNSIDFTFSIINSFMNNYYGQCWTMIPESDAFWRIYSYDKQTIRIEIDYDSVTKLDGVQAYKVEYIDEVDLKGELKSIIGTENFGLSLEKAFIRKRKAFEHEHEVRLLKNMENEDNTINMPITSSDDIISDLKLELSKVVGELSSDIDITNIIEIPDKVPSIMVSDSIDFNNGSNVKPYIGVSYSTIKDFIKSVMLHPLAPQWFDSTLKEYCKNNNINYLGKSKLYDLDLK